MVKAKVAIYVRKSRKNKNTVEESLETQRKMLEEIAINKGYEYQVFQEIGSSQNKLRPEFNKMMEGIGEEFNRVLVYDKSRLSRNKLIDAEMEEIFKECGIIVETPYKEIDYTDPDQTLRSNIENAVDIREYENTRKKLSDGRFNTVAINKRWLGSRPALGFDWDRNVKKLIINPKEKEIVRKMVELALQGYSSRQIADKLNKLGYRGKLGAPFKTDRILEVLHNRVYLGEAKLNSVRKKQTAIAKDCHDAIITEDEFNQIQALFKGRRSGAGKYGSLGAKSPLNGLLICSVCNKGLTIQLNNKGISKVTGKSLAFYQIRPCIHFLDEDRLIKCHNRGVKISTIEEAVKEALKNYRQDILEALSKLNNQDTSDMEQNLKNNLNLLTKELKKKETGIKRLLELYVEEQEINKQEYTESKRVLEGSKNELLAEIELVSNKLKNIDTSTQISKLERVKEMIDEFDDMELEEQNALLKTVINKIVFTKTPDTNNQPEIDIHWREL
jgi:DNA invertase Pin-like site-specific DNA recombinase